MGILMNDEINDEIDEIDDIEIPKLAEEALRAAQKKAMETGPVVMRQGDQLVRRDPDGTITVLKDLPPRKRVGKGVRVRRKIGVQVPRKIIWVGKPMGDGTPLETERDESP